jgi:SagB-type dehydrogenase family enzyme
LRIEGALCLRIEAVMIGPLACHGSVRMNNDRVGRRFGFLCSRLDDPRRMQLREGQFLHAYRNRHNVDDITEISHNLTKLRRVDDSDVAAAFAVFQQPTMYSVEYTQDREYPLQARIRLPDPKIPDRSFSELIRRRRSARTFDCRPLALAELSALLFCALGETGRLTTAFEDECPVEASLRSIPSGGALHPTHLFAAVLQHGDLAKGIYHYDSPVHELECVKPLASTEIEALFAAFPIHPRVVDLASAAALFLLTTKFWRSRAKYGPRGYRYCLQEVGSACQNLCLAAVAFDLSHVVLGGFYDDEVHERLEIDGVEHAVIAAIAVGPPPAQLKTDAPNVEL